MRKYRNLAGAPANPKLGEDYEDNRIHPPRVYIFDGEAWERQIPDVSMLTADEVQSAVHGMFPSGQFIALEAMTVSLEGNYTREELHFLAVAMQRLEELAAMRK